MGSLRFLSFTISHPAWSCLLLLVRGFFHYFKFYEFLSCKAAIESFFSFFYLFFLQVILCIMANLEFFDTSSSGTSHMPRMILFLLSSGSAIFFNFFYFLLCSSHSLWLAWLCLLIWWLVIWGRKMMFFEQIEFSMNFRENIYIYSDNIWLAEVFLFSFIS